MTLGAVGVRAARGVPLSSGEGLWTGVSSSGVPGVPGVDERVAVGRGTRVGVRRGRVGEAAAVAVRGDAVIVGGSVGGGSSVAVATGVGDSRGARVAGNGGKVAVAGAVSGATIAVGAGAAKSQAASARLSTSPARIRPPHRARARARNVRTRKMDGSSCVAARLDGLERQTQAAEHHVIAGVQRLRTVGRDALLVE